jgi:hypothetical protein
VRLTNSNVHFSFEGVRAWLVGLAAVLKVSLLLYYEE